MIRQLLVKLLGIETISIAVAEIAPTLQDPCSRHIDQSSAEIYSILGRNCIPGDFVRNTASTPETAAVQYGRI